MRAHRLHLPVQVRLKSRKAFENRWPPSGLLTGVSKYTYVAGLLLCVDLCGLPLCVDVVCLLLRFDLLSLLLFVDLCFQCYTHGVCLLIACLLD